MLKHRPSDIGVVVALPGGLITPIVRNAEMKSLSVISNEMRDSRRGRVPVSSSRRNIKVARRRCQIFGMYGIKDFTAVITAESTILRLAPARNGPSSNGTIEAAIVMSVTLSCDHRAVDCRHLR